MELSNVQLEGELGQALEDIDPVPEADPEAVREILLATLDLKPRDANLLSVTKRMFTHDGPLGGQGPHVRRKSVLPGTFFLGSCLDRTELDLDFG
jgi:hypothetical protein